MSIQWNSIYSCEWQYFHLRKEKIYYVVLRYLVAWGRDRTADRAAAAREWLWLGRRSAAAAGRGVVVHGVVLVHDPGKRKISVDDMSSDALKKILWQKISDSAIPFCVPKVDQIGKWPTWTVFKTLWYPPQNSQNSLAISAINPVSSKWNNLRQLPRSKAEIILFFVNSK